MKTQIRKGFDVDTVILSILIALSALVFKFSPVPVLGTYFGAKVQFLEIAFVLLFPIWLFLTFRRDGFVLKLPRGTFFFLGFVIVAFVSSLLSINPKRSLLDSTGFLYLFLLLLFFYNLLSKKNLIGSLKFFLVISNVVIVVGILGLLLYYFFGLETFAIEVVDYVPGLRLIRTCSTFFTSNYMVVYLGFAVAVGMTFLHGGEKGWFRMLSIALIVMTSLVLISQPYRGEFIIWGVIFFGLGRFKQRPAIRLIRPVVLMLAVIFFVLFVVQGLINISPIRVSSDSLTKRFGVSISTEPTSYSCLHRTAFRIFKDYPVIGVGPGLYNTYMQQEKFGFDFVTFSFHIGGGDPHSTYLGYLAETGVLGAVLIIAFFIVMLWRLNILAHNEDTFFRLLGRNALCYFALLLIYAFFIDIVTIRFLYFMYALVFFITDRAGLGNGTVAARG
jgi:O-antigen ligase